MTRDYARELAAQIIFGSEYSGIDIYEYADDFLAPDRFELLSGENEIYNCNLDRRSEEFILSLINRFNENKTKIDSLISDNSNGWKITRISSTALAVIRVAVCEMLFFDDIPIAVSINSAVEIDKKYDDDDVVSFVNGVLGSISKSI